MWITAVWYLGRMLYRTMAVGLIQTVVLSFGLTGLSDNAAEAAANPPVAMVTNVVAQRAVRDVLQTLLAVTPADKPVGLVHFACGQKGAIETRAERFGDRGRAEVRLISVATAIDLLLAAAAHGVP